jgi:uncharacterized protein (TIGR00255 family)
MRSMTAYAFRERRGEGFSLSLELKGYNSRFLEIFLYLPPALSAFEGELRDYLGSRFSRGKVELSARLREEGGGLAVSLNRGALRAYAGAFREAAEFLGSGEKPSPSWLLGMEGVLELERDREGEPFGEALRALLREAADQFEGERLREGKHTGENILSELSLLEAALGTVSALAPELERAIQENLRARFAALLGDRIDEDRVLAETAALLIKYSVAEELSRLSAHLAEFRAEMERNPAPGKKLDFLSQEINREINTIGSKSPRLEVSRAVVEMKNALENIREQLRNVE